MGHDVDEVEYSFDFDALGEIFSRIACAATAAGIHSLEPVMGRPPREGELGNVIREMVERGERISAPALAQDIEAMHMAGWTIAGDCDPYDVVITPTMPNPPHKVGHYDMSLPFETYNNELLMPEVVFTLPHNVSGLPAMSAAAALEQGRPALRRAVHCKARKRRAPVPTGGAPGRGAALVR